ncbi:centrosomal protein kizuna isoform X2 [Rhincodon typus]|uniref:centrosomal protein kizuna isoform X2 n=1 Tax=Rhincodon typus TaxID=259920 RepID=UPI00202F33DE|nr:centrosomal protein kizuna isoform X2 [Rhincodon typus]
MRTVEGTCSFATALRLLREGGGIRAWAQLLWQRSKPAPAEADMAASDPAFLARLGELQRQLHGSEQQRLDLEQNLLKCRKSSQWMLKRARLKSYLKELRERERKAQLRNRQLLKDFENIEAQVAALTSGSDTLKQMKIEYEKQIEKLMPVWSENLKAQRKEKEVTIEQTGNSSRQKDTDVGKHMSKGLSTTFVMDQQASWTSNRTCLSSQEKCQQHVESFMSSQPCKQAASMTATHGNSVMDNLKSPMSSKESQDSHTVSDIIERETGLQTSEVMPFTPIISSRNERHRYEGIECNRHIRANGSAGNQELPTPVTQLESIKEELTQTTVLDDFKNRLTGEENSHKNVIVSEQAPEQFQRQFMDLLQDDACSGGSSMNVKENNIFQSGNKTPHQQEVNITVDKGSKLKQGKEMKTRKKRNMPKNVSKVEDSYETFMNTVSSLNQKKDAEETPRPSQDVQRLADEMCDSESDLSLSVNGEDLKLKESFENPCNHILLRKTTFNDDSARSSESACTKDKSFTIFKEENIAPLVNRPDKKDHGGSVEGDLHGELHEYATESQQNDTCLSLEGFFHLLQTIEDGVKETVATYSQMYQLVTISNEKLQEITSTCNKKGSVSRENLDVCGAVVLHQLKGLSQSTSNGCLLTEEILNKEWEATDGSNYRLSELPADSATLWDRWYLHVLSMLEHQVLTTDEAAEMFGPLLVAESSNNSKKATALLKKILPKEIEKQSFPSDDSSCSLPSIFNDVEIKPEIPVPCFDLKSTKQQGLSKQKYSSKVKNDNKVEVNFETGSSEESPQLRDRSKKERINPAKSKAFWGESDDSASDIEAILHPKTSEIFEDRDDFEDFF